MKNLESLTFKLSNQDYDWLCRLKNNDTKAFSEIYFTYWENFHDYCLRYLKNENLVKDVLHDVFLEFWKIRGKLEIKYSIKAYLAVCIKNKCIFVLKQMRRFEFLEIEDYDFQSVEHDQFSVRDIESQLNYVLTEKITNKSRIIFELNRNEDLSYKEIAYRLNLSVKSVEYHMSKVLTILRKSILTLITCMLFF
ncbi:RNA polymerase sigma-70 factor [Sphingobacterium kyonggiense]|uniref:RNA polymerase sigma-70 factor n=1 Tax=Sphingobacterium kyonggiense TaxID=714075 RepID=A0ABP7YKA4_9SPHI